MDKNYFKDYYILERNHWWFKARLEILEELVSKFFEKTKTEPPKILNAGVATGATSFMLEKFGKVTSLEYDQACCEFLRETVNLEVTQGSLTALPYNDHSFDMVCAFDVIEHIEDDVTAVSEIKRVLKPNGKIFLTVPAYMFLWSEHDVINHHFRRYTSANFSSLIQKADLNIAYKSYFNFLLFLPIAAARTASNFLQKFKKKGNKKISDFQKFKTEGLVDKLFYKIFKSEKGLIKRKFRLPFGVSLLLVADKS